MPEERSESARWPGYLRDLCRQWLTRKDTPAGQRLRTEIWTILSLALQNSLASKRFMSDDLTREDLEDLASEKSFRLLQRLESGQWDIRDRSPAEIAAFLATTAHHGLIDLLRSPERRRQRRRPAEAEAALTGEDLPSWDTPDLLLERQEFIAALRTCLEELQPRLRRIWFFRACYGLASKEIAAHPQVGLKPSRVDELLYDVRQLLSGCMERKGQRLRQLPTGAFYEIWRSLRGFRLEEVGIDEEAFDASC